MPGTIFSLDDDARVFMARVTQSLDRVDAALLDVKDLAQNLNHGVTELRETVAKVNAGLDAVGGKS